MDSNLKVGSVATKGLYVGSSEIMGGGWNFNLMMILIQVLLLLL